MYPHMFSHMSQSLEQFATLATFKVPIVLVTEHMFVKGISGSESLVAVCTLMWA